MASRKPSLTDQIRRAIEQSAVSRYRIAQETGVAESTLCRFMDARADCLWTRSTGLVSICI